MCCSRCQVSQDEGGVFLSFVGKDDAADSKMELEEGDYLVKVGGEDVTGWQVNAVKALFKDKTKHSIKMIVRRPLESLDQVERERPVVVDDSGLMDYKDPESDGEDLLQLEDSPLGPAPNNTEQDLFGSSPFIPTNTTNVFGPTNVFGTTDAFGGTPSNPGSPQATHLSRQAVPSSILGMSQGTGLMDRWVAYFI